MWQHATALNDEWECSECAFLLDFATFSKIRNTSQTLTSNAKHFRSAPGCVDLPWKWVTRRDPTTGLLFW